MGVGCAINGGIELNGIWDTEMRKFTKSFLIVFTVLVVVLVISVYFVSPGIYVEKWSNDAALLAYAEVPKRLNAFYSQIRGPKVRADQTYIRVFNKTDGRSSLVEVQDYDPWGKKPAAIYWRSNSKEFAYLYSNVNVVEAHYYVLLPSGEWKQKQTRNYEGWLITQLRPLKSQPRNESNWAAQYYLNSVDSDS